LGGIVKIAYLAINLWEYEKILRVPEGLPEDMIPFYITDSEKILKEARSKGWYGAVVSRFSKEMDNHERRKIVANIQCYPERYIDLSNYRYVFVCDSNIIKLPSNYKKFVEFGITSGKACFTESGYYSGARDNIYNEYLASNQPRWTYNYSAMGDCVAGYIKEMENLGINYRNESIASGKYIGWDLKHPEKNVVSDFVCKEEEKHIQGNIILTMARVLYPYLVSNFRSLKGDGSLSGHNFQG
jgi:hypothetical protein